MVNHSLLINKLEHYGVRGICLKWFTSYLSNRTQAVEIPYQDKKGNLSSIISNKNIVKTGVPQGSILGPILFVLYMNDLNYCMKFSNTYLFADDTTLLVSNQDKHILKQDLLTQCSNLIEWLTKNNFQTNFSKTNIIEFSIQNKFNSEKITLILENEQVTLTNEINFLGLKLDRNLKFKTHIDFIYKKLSKNLFVLRRLSKISTRDIIHSAYFGLIIPLMSYCVSIWGMSSDCSRIFKIQKAAVRIMYSKPRRYPCKSLFQNYRLLTFPCIYIYELAKFTKIN